MARVSVRVCAWWGVADPGKLYDLPDPSFPLERDRTHLRLRGVRPERLGEQHGQRHVEGPKEEQAQRAAAPGAGGEAHACY